MNEKRIVLLLGILALIFLSFISRKIYFKKTKVVAAAGGTYVEGAVGKPKWINPLLATTKTEFDIISLIYSPLFSRDNQGRIKPVLAEKIIVDSGGKRYIIKLKDKIFWHDGEGFSAEDVLFTLSLIKDENYDGYLKSAFGNVAARINKKGEIVFDLPEANFYFPDFLTSLYILPKHLLSEENFASLEVSEFNNKPIGTGLFKFKSLEERANCQIITLTRNKEYFAEIPLLDKFVFKYYQNKEELLLGLKKGEISGIADIREKDFELEENLNLKQYYLYLPRYISLFFNLDEKRLSKNVRIAFASAVDKKKLVKNIYQNQAEVINSPFLPSFFRGIKTNENYNFAPEKAKKRLKNLRAREKRFVLTFPVEDELFCSLAEALKTFFKAVGIEIKEEPLPTEQIIKDVLPQRRFELLLFGSSFGYSLDPYPFWHSSEKKRGGLNISGYSDLQVDSLLENIRKIKNLGTKEKLITKLDKKIVTDLPAIFLLSPHYQFCTNQKIQGIPKESFGYVSADRFAEVASWYIKMKRVKK